MAEDRVLKYLLDTNVISELRRKAKMAPGVRQWVAGIAEDDLATSVLVLAEVRLGIELLRRRDRSQASLLDAWFAAMRRQFAGRILAVDELASEAWVQLNVPDRMEAIDSLIAATARVHGLVLVTRNTRDFHKSKVSVLNPFGD
jgi:toxin FitB